MKGNALTAFVASSFASISTSISASTFVSIFVPVLACVSFFGSVTAQAASSRDCSYHIEAALDPQVVSFLAAKGYTPSFASRSALNFDVRTDAARSGWFYGSVTYVRMTDVMTKNVVAEGWGNFSVGSAIDVWSALKRLPPCP